MSLEIRYARADELGKIVDLDGAALPRVVGDPAAVSVLDRALLAETEPQFGTYF